MSSIIRQHGWIGLVYPYSLSLFLSGRKLVSTTTESVTNVRVWRYYNRNTILFKLIPSSNYGMHQKKMTPTFATFFRNAFAVQLCRKSEGFFRESEDFFWACTHIIFRNVVQLCYGSSGAVFVMAKQHSNGNCFHKHIILSTCTVKPKTKWLISF